uniref:GnRHR3 gonadotropin-releasing hormone receptor 3 n=1 Tax=Phallusia mammillata TaxID=59560 RepID=A0A6F9DEH2_9ASCI|nr:GnRHR3 gonadotropin-releasing hormone receptor 3 [Phallusia mammillata]
MSSDTTYAMLNTTAMPYATGIWNTTVDEFPACDYFRKFLQFNTSQLVRVIFTWLFFLFSATGNLFVLYCLWGARRKSHVLIITIHLTLADLAFTFFSMPMDATWNLIMQWYGGDVLCRLCNMLKQFGMYISSLMVVVTALDRVFSILSPMSNVNQQRSRTRILLIGAWLIAFFSSIPPLFIFSISERQFCADEAPFVQCVDFKVIDRQMRRVYLFFTMSVSFIIPFIFTVVSYSLILCEISNMLRRDRRIMGRRDNISNMANARKKTFILTSIVAATFLLLWGPYYAYGVVTWFDRDISRSVSMEVTNALYMLMYLHPAVHPILYGFFVRDIRKRFVAIFRVCIKHPDGRPRKMRISRTSDEMKRMNSAH